MEKGEYTLLVVYFVAVKSFRTDTTSASWAAWAADAIIQKDRQSTRPTKLLVLYTQRSNLERVTGELNISLSSRYSQCLQVSRQKIFHELRVTRTVGTDRSEKRDDSSISTNSKCRWSIDNQELLWLYHSGVPCNIRQRNVDHWHLVRNEASMSIRFHHLKKAQITALPSQKWYTVTPMPAPAPMWHGSLGFVIYERSPWDYGYGGKWRIIWALWIRWNFESERDCQCGLKPRAGINGCKVSAARN